MLQVIVLIVAPNIFYALQQLYPTDLLHATRG